MPEQDAAASAIHALRAADARCGAAAAAVCAGRAVDAGHAGGVGRQRKSVERLGHVRAAAGPRLIASPPPGVWALRNMFFLLLSSLLESLYCPMLIIAKKNCAGSVLSSTMTEDAWTTLCVGGIHTLQDSVHHISNFFSST